MKLRLSSVVFQPLFVVGVVMALCLQIWYRAAGISPLWLIMESIRIIGLLIGMSLGVVVLFRVHSKSGTPWIRRLLWRLYYYMCLVLAADNPGECAEGIQQHSFYAGVASWILICTIPLFPYWWPGSARRKCLLWKHWRLYYRKQPVASDANIPWYNPAGINKAD
jgi:hypothetical protein